MIIALKQVWAYRKKFQLFALRLLLAFTLLPITFCVGRTEIIPNSIIHPLIRKADSLTVIDFATAVQISDSLLQLEISDLEKGILYRIKGLGYYHQGDFATAGQLLTQSIQTLQRIQAEQELGLTLIQQAKLLRKLKMFEDAIETYRLAYNIFIKHNEKNHLATTLNEWGALYEIMEQYEKAEDYFLQSLRLKEELHDDIGIAYSSGFLSNVYFLQKKYDLAEEFGLRSLRLFNALKNDFSIALRASDVSQIYIQKKDYPEALHYLKLSDSIAQQLKYLDLIALNYKRFAELFALEKKFDSAYAYFQLHADLKDSLFNARSQSIIAELNVKFQSSEKDKNLLLHKNSLQKRNQQLLIAFFLLGSSVLTAYFIYKKRKNKERRLIQEHLHKEQLINIENENKLQKQRLEISRDLHDNIGSYLTFIKTSIDHIESKELRSNPKLKNVQQLTAETIAELRRTVWLINKPIVSLEEWITKLRDYYRHLPMIKIAPFDGDNVSLNTSLATGIFRITQEAVNNALKYAQSKEILITIIYQGSQLKITIQDYGKGFDYSINSKGFGINNMHQRAEELNGKISIRSVLGKGTTITFEMELKQ